MKVDIILKNGRVISEANGLDETADVAIADGKIAAIGRNLQWEAPDNQGDFKFVPEIADVSGCVVVPGLIDSHVHVFQKGCFGAVDADTALFPTGCTCGIDAGSAGILNYDAFSELAVRRSASDVRALLNISPVGLGMGHYFPENADPRYYDESGIEKCLAEHPGEILGFKLRINRRVIGELGTAPLERTVAAAERFGLPVVIHANDPFAEQTVVLDILRPGDVYAHVFGGKGYTVIDESGRVKECVKRARRRGVVFDSANGGGNFSWQVYDAACSEGFWPDIISSDITPLTFNRGPMYSLAFTMSKYLNFGMSLKEVIGAVTSVPAKVYGLNSGALYVGADADIAVFRETEAGPVKFYDAAGGQYREGNILLKPMMTIRKGTIMFRDISSCV